MSLTLVSLLEDFFFFESNSTLGNYNWSKLNITVSRCYIWEYYFGKDFWYHVWNISSKWNRLNCFCMIFHLIKEGEDMQDLPLKLDRLCLADFWKVRNQCDPVVDNPAHGRRVGTKWSLRSPPTKTVSWFYEGNIKMFRKETWILGEVLLFLFS